MKRDLKVSVFFGNYCHVTYRPFDPEITLAFIQAVALVQAMTFILYLSFVANFSSFSLAESSPRDLQITADK